MPLNESDALHAASEACDELLTRVIDAGGWRHADTTDLIAIAGTMSAYATAVAATETARLAEITSDRLAKIAEQTETIADQLAELSATAERSRWTGAMSA